MIFLWVFFPVTLISYYLLLATRKQEIVNLLLLFMSLLFYTFGEPKYILLLFITVAVNYFGGLLIEKAGESNWKKAALTATVVLDLGILGYFKYYTFAAETWNLLMKWEIFSIKQVALPVGISFYTFQALSYVIDLYRGKCGVQRSFYKLLLYISFFPQLIAGPIVRYQSIEAQIDQRRVDFNKFSEGTARFIAGLGMEELLGVIAQQTGETMETGEGTFEESGTRRGDLQKLASLNGAYDSQEYTLVPAPEYETTKAIQDNNDEVIWESGISRNPQCLPVSLYLTGDSFRWNAGAYLQEAAKESVVTSRYYFDTDDLVVREPDVFVYMIAERFLHELSVLPGYNTMPLQMPEVP